MLELLITGNITPNQPATLKQDGRATDSCFALVGAHQCGVLMDGSQSVGRSYHPPACLTLFQCSRLVWGNSTIDPDLIVGVTTEVIAGEGHMLTAGALDVHVHFIRGCLWQPLYCFHFAILLYGFMLRYLYIIREATVVLLH